MLVGVGNRIWIRSIEARSRGSRRVSRVLFGRRTRVGCRSVLRTGSPVRVLLLVERKELEVAGGKKALGPNHDFHRLNVFFAIASTTCNVSALAVGTILDRYGPRVAGIIGSLSLAAGSALMGSAFAIPEFDGYILGNILLSLGGTFIFVPSFQVANAFPKWSGTIVAMVTGAFDASVSMTSSPAEQQTVRQLTIVCKAAVFLFFRIAYEASGGTFGPEKFFFGYLIVPALILIAQLTVMNHDGYKTLPQLERKIEKEQDYSRDVSSRLISTQTG